MKKLTIYLKNVKKDKDKKFKNTFSFHKVSKKESFRIINDLFKKENITRATYGHEVLIENKIEKI